MSKLGKHIYEQGYNLDLNLDYNYKVFPDSFTFGGVTGATGVSGPTINALYTDVSSIENWISVMDTLSYSCTFSIQEADKLFQLSGGLTGWGGLTMSTQQALSEAFLVPKINRDLVHTISEQAINAEKIYLCTNEQHSLDDLSQTVNFIVNSDGNTVQSYLNNPSNFIGSGGGSVSSVNGQSGTVVLNVNDLGDVNTNGISNEHILKYNGVSWVTELRPQIKIHPLSQNYMNYNNLTGELFLENLAIADVKVDTSATSSSIYLNIPSNISPYQKGDTIIFTNTTNGTEIFIHNGGLSNTATDFTQIETPNASDSYIKTLLSAQTPIYYNNTTGVISITQSGTQSSGYLSSFDYNKFDGKVDSVNGKIGNIILTSSNINEGTNLYYTDTRARNSITGATGISYSQASGVIQANINDVGLGLTELWSANKINSEISSLISGIAGVSSINGSTGSVSIGLNSILNVDNKTSGINVNVSQGDRVSFGTLDNIYKNSASKPLTIEAFSKGLKIWGNTIVNTLFNGSGVSISASGSNSSIDFIVNTPEPFIQTTSNISGFSGVLNLSSNLTSNKAWILPDNNGTLLVDSDIVGFVTSVNGQTASVNLNTSHITESTNLYYTDSRARSSIGVSQSSSNYLNYDSNTGLFDLKNLSITSVKVDNIATESNSYFLTNYSGSEFQEGDTIVLSAITNGVEIYMHTGATSGTSTDFINIQTPNVSDSHIKNIFSAITPLSYNNTNGVFSIGKSDTNNDGYLISSDWYTFNSKLGGSGSTDYIGRWSSSNTLINSSIRDNGSVVAIGATPTTNRKFYVNSTNMFINTSLTSNYTGASEHYTALLQGNGTSIGVKYGLLSTVTGGNQNISIYGAAGNSSGNFVTTSDIGVLGQSRNTTRGNIGIFGLADQPSSFDNIAGYFKAGNPGTGNGYALKLIDGNEGINKALLSDALGHATWQTLTSDIITENTNLFYTDVRSRNSITGATGINYNSTTGIIEANINDSGTQSLDLWSATQIQNSIDLTRNSNTILIRTLSDLPTPVSGKITLLSSKKYIFSAPINIGTNYIEMGNNTVLDSINHELTMITYSGTGAAIRGVNITCTIREIQINGSGTSDGFSFTGSKTTEAVTIFQCQFVNCVNVGTANGLFFFNYNTTTHLANSNGVVVTDSLFAQIINTTWFSNNSGTFISLPSGAFNSLKLDANNIDAPLGAVGINISEGIITHLEDIVISGNVIVGTSITPISGFNPLDSRFESIGNIGIVNNTSLESTTNSEMFNINNPRTGSILFNTTLGANGEIVYYNGAIWESLKDSIIYNTHFYESFESGSLITNGWVTIPDSKTDWYIGNIGAISGGTFGIYISDDGGITSDYPKNTIQATHIYIDILLPTNIVATRIFLQFDWEAEGITTQDYCELHDVPPTTVPVAGTQLGATGLIGNQYSNKLLKQTETIELPIIEAGTTRRFVWTWINDANGNRQRPPMKIDDVKILFIP